MSIFHELQEDYRYYRHRNPQYRLLFLLGDLAGLLVKLALFAGFLYLCWYIINRNPLPPPQTGLNAAAVTSEAASETTSPALTSGRIALLEKIASEGSATASGLIGSVSPGGDRSYTVADQPVPAVPGKVARRADSFGDQITQPVVQVESGIALNSGYIEVDEIPTVFIETGDTTEDIFIPPAPAESGRWVRNQSPSDYTVQLALTVNVDFLLAFSKRLPSEHIAAIYPERRTDKGDFQYSLSLGSFTDLQSAEKVLSSLSKNLKRYDAHTRKFGEIQKNLDALIR